MGLKVITRSDNRKCAMTTSQESNRNESAIRSLEDTIQSLDKPSLVSVIAHYERVWGLEARCANRLDASRLGFKPGQFFEERDINKTTGFPDSINMRDVEDRANRVYLKLKQIGQRLHLVFDDENGSDQLAVVHTADVPELSLGERVNRLIKHVSRAFSLVHTHAMIDSSILDPRAAPERFDADPEYFRATPITSKMLDEMSPFQRGICACLHELSLRGWKRYKGACCHQLVVDGHFTRAWSRVKEIKEFVSEMADKDSHYERWRDLTTKGSTFNEVARHLEVCTDHQFPEIKKNRQCWSFKNGMFCGKVWKEDLQRYVAEFLPYESREFQMLDPSVVAAKYFEKEFVDHTQEKDWYEIPTKHMQSILDYQGFNEDVCRWTYVMIGRLAYEIGEVGENWQIIPFFKGVARSGKSTLVTRVCKAIFETEDVRTLSNNIETKFGLSSIYDGFMFLAPEIKGNIQLEQAEFQSIVSGEDVSLAVKHEKAKSIVWKVPGVLAGNQIPDWRDNAGSILRRILPWNFGRQVKDADPHLDRKLDEEFPLILQKCVLGYLDYVDKFADKDIWNCVPRYFKTIQEDLAKNVSTLLHFMTSSDVKYNANLCIPMSEFIALFSQHCKFHNLPRSTFNKDFYAGPFSQRDVTVREGHTGSWGGKMYVNKPFIFGLNVECAANEM